MHASDQATDQPFSVDPDVGESGEDDRFLNILQVLFIAFGLALVCGFSTRAMGYGWAAAVLVSWGSSVFGTLALVLAIFAVREAALPLGNDLSGPDVPSDDDPVPDVFWQETGRDIDARLSRFWSEDVSDETADKQDPREADQESRRRS